jgi:hypothetical protein
MHSRTRTLLVAVLTASTFTGRAEEGGSGHYIPGSMSSFADGVPTEETFVTRYNMLYYSGEIDVAGGPLPIAGLNAAGAEASSWAHGLTMLWRTPWDLGDDKLGYAFSVTVPTVSVDVKAQVGPFQRSDTIDALGDMVIMPVMFNYQFNDDFNLNGRFGIYAPTGEYEVGQLANAGKNYWSYEPTIGLMYFGRENGIEASLFGGATFNSENPDTNYETGTQVHLDGVLAQHFPLGKGLAGFGVNGFWYEQISGDSGPGAFLGEFEGRTAGLGPAVSYAGKIGDTDFVAELKWLHEMETKRRLEGDYVWLKVLFKF